MKEGQKEEGKRGVKGMRLKEQGSEMAVNWK